MSFEFNHDALAELQDRLSTAMSDLKAEAQSAFDEVFEEHAHGDVDVARAAMLARFRRINSQTTEVDVEEFARAVAAGTRIEFRLEDIGAGPAD